MSPRGAHWRKREVPNSLAIVNIPLRNRWQEKIPPKYRTGSPPNIKIYFFITEGYVFHH